MKEIHNKLVFGGKNPLKLKKKKQEEKNITCYFIVIFGIAYSIIQKNPTKSVTYRTWSMVRTQKRLDYQRNMFIYIKM